MTFDELDRRMRVFETANDPVVLPAIYMLIARDHRPQTQEPEITTRLVRTRELEPANA